MCAETVSPQRAVLRFRDLLHCSSGAAAVEFAFVFPLLIMLVLGVYSVGAVMHSISSVRYALEETGRMLQMDHSLTESDLQTALNGKLDQLGKQEVTLTMKLEKDAFGSDIARLTASYPYTIAVPFIPKYEGAYKQSVEIFLTIVR